MRSDQDLQRWEEHQARCLRIADAARADGWEIPEGPARIVYTGIGDDGYYAVVIGDRASAPLRKRDTDEAALLAAFVAHLETVGVPRPVCYRCPRYARGARGTIYVRRRIDGTFQSVPVCYLHWNREHPNEQVDEQGEPVGRGEP